MCVFSTLCTALSSVESCWGFCVLTVVVLSNASPCLTFAAGGRSVCLSVSPGETLSYVFSSTGYFADMKGTFQKETCSRSFNFEYSFQSFKFWMVYI